VDTLDESVTPHLGDPKAKHAVNKKCENEGGGKNSEPVVLVL
jgi:hypothetical protein